MEKIRLENIEAQLYRKKVRNLNIRVCAPDGKVKISAPFRINIERIYEFFSSKTQWVKKCQNRILSRKYLLPLQFKNGEEHFFLGEKFVLEVVENAKKSCVKIENGILFLHVRGNSTKKKRAEILQKFYRDELKKNVAQMIKKWEVVMNVLVADFGIKKMKTRWGTCNIRARRIWINLELAKSPISCLEDIVIHEMVHLLERNHTKRFFELMDKFSASWRQTKAKLREFPLR